MNSSSTKFIPGLKLGRLFFKKIIQPILSKDFPELKYTAGLLGEGSEILGYDIPQSTDHCWGPRTMLFLPEADYPKINKKLRKILMGKIPQEFMGYLTDLNCAVKSTVDIFTIPSFLEKQLGLDSVEKLELTDWLRLPAQRLLEVISGEVFHDDLGLKKLRNKFAYYPKDIWLYLLACQWIKISQEEAFTGRCSAVGDELGSQVVASRMVRELMKLCFLMEQKYAPYSKWFGTAFRELKIARELSPILQKVLFSQTWEEREKRLSQAYEIVAKKHNSLNITPALSTKVSKFYDRPYLVIHADRFAEAIRKEIRNRKIRGISTNAGAIDQFVDSTDVLSYPQIFKKIMIWS